MAAAVDARTTVGDRLFSFRFSGLRDADGVLYTFVAPQLRMMPDGSTTPKINWASCTPAGPGVVTYAPVAGDVDTEGTFWLQVRDTVATKVHHWPAGREWKLEIVPEV